MQYWTGSGDELRAGACMASPNLHPPSLAHTLLSVPWLVCVGRHGCPWPRAHDRRCDTYRCSTGRGLAASYVRMRAWRAPTCSCPCPPFTKLPLVWCMMLVRWPPRLPLAPRS